MLQALGLQQHDPASLRTHGDSVAGRPLYDSLHRLKQPAMVDTRCEILLDGFFFFLFFLDVFVPEPKRL